MKSVWRDHLRSRWFFLAIWAVVTLLLVWAAATTSDPMGWKTVAVVGGGGLFAALFVGD